MSVPHTLVPSPHLNCFILTLRRTPHPSCWTATATWFLHRCCRIWPCLWSCWSLFLWCCFCFCSFRLLRKRMIGSSCGTLSCCFTFSCKSMPWSTPHFLTDSQSTAHFYHLLSQCVNSSLWPQAKFFFWDSFKLISFIFSHSSFAHIW